jgi:hypothetical protein
VGAGIRLAWFVISAMLLHSYDVEVANIIHIQSIYIVCVCSQSCIWLKANCTNDHQLLPSLPLLHVLDMTAKSFLLYPVS